MIIGQNYVLLNPTTLFSIYMPFLNSDILTHDIF